MPARTGHETRKASAASVPLNPRDFMILLALAGGKRHGYGVIKEIEMLTDGEVRTDPANLYRSIKRLLRDGLIEDAGRRQAAESGQERRRFYAITAAGRRLASAEAARLEKLTAAARARLLIPGSEGSA